MPRRSPKGEAGLIPPQYYHFPLLNGPPTRTGLSACVPRLIMRS